MRKSDLIYYFLLIVVIAGLGYMIHLIKSESSQCLKNPYVYGANKMGNVECSCTQFNNPICPAKFFFNETSFDTPTTRCGQEKNYTYISQLNLSNLIVK